MERMKTVVESLTITVTDVDDELPTMLRLVDGGVDVSQDITVLEGSVEVLGTLTAEDVDTEDADLVYSTSDSRFEIEKTTDGYVLKTTNLLDYEDVVEVNDDGTTELEVTVNDGVVGHDYVRSFYYYCRGCE